MYLLAVIYILIFLILLLILFAVMQIRLAGMKVKDFWTFIEANQILDKLYLFTTKYKKLSIQEQVIFLEEAEKVFNAFDKVPELLWEEEYQKYMEVLNTYKDIKMLRWVASDKEKIYNALKKKMKIICSILFLASKYCFIKNLEKNITLQK